MLLGMLHFACTFGMTSKWMLGFLIQLPAPKLLYPHNHAKPGKYLTRTTILANVGPYSWFYFTYKL
jgi:hypothetical protein